MILVIDTNIIIAAIIRNSTTQDIIFNENLQLYSPEYVLSEIKNHKAELIRKSGYTSEMFDTISELVFSKITIVPCEEYAHHQNHAINISPDKEDWPFFALCIHMHALLWSNDAKLKDQKVIKVITTNELISVITCSDDI